MVSWLETEAPVRFEELAVPEPVHQTLSSTSTSTDPPHLLITGPAGVGKTACWRLFARQILGAGWKSTTHVLQARDLVRQRGAMATFEEFLRPSGSEKDTLAGRTSLDAFDRGISSPKTAEVAPAGSEVVFKPGDIPISRLIVIEDADYLGHIRQAYLRRMMETVGSASRFVLIARAPSRIIDALRSRSQMIRIPSTDRETITSTLSEIAKRKNCEPADGVLEDIAYISDGNLKRAIFTLELLDIRGLASDRSSVHKMVQASTLQAGRRLVELAIRGKVVEWKWENRGGRNRKVLSGAMAEVDDLMNNHGLDATDLISQIHGVIVGRRLSVPQGLREEMLDALSECDVGLQRSTYPRIHFERFLHRTAIAGKHHGLSIS
jgi:DNA polymerase III delta prime subunit